MSYRYADFQQQAALVALETVWIPTRNADFQTVATALAADTTTHDATIQSPAAGMVPGYPSNGRVINALLKIVNRGKAGNLSNSAMVNALDGIIAVGAPPGVIDVPFVSGNGVVGQILNTTNGNWVGTPTFTYQWKSAGANATRSGATTANYTIAAADSGKAVGCVVTGTNVSGSTAAPLSNTIQVA